MRLFASNRSRGSIAYLLVLCMIMFTLGAYPAYGDDASSTTSTPTAEDIDSADDEVTDQQAKSDEADAQQAAAAYAAAEASGANMGILPRGLSSNDATFVGIARLARADLDLDATLVSFTGEVVGEPINSATSGRRWITLVSNVESTSTIGVLMDEEQIGLIENFGSYQVEGTTLLVTGIYRVADANETGTLDVTAYDVSVVSAGGPLHTEPVLSKLYVGIGSIIFGALLVTWGIWRKRRAIT